MHGSDRRTRATTLQSEHSEFPGGARLLAVLAAVAILYCVTGRLALTLAVPPGYATAIWPPAGLALAAVLIYGCRVWPGILFGSFAVNLWMAAGIGGPWGTDQILAAGLVAVGAVAQTLFSFVLLRHFVGLPLRLNTLPGVASFFVLGGAVGCLLNSILGPSVLLALDIITPAQFWFNAWNWWVGDTIGVLVMTPLLLIWSNHAGRSWRDQRLGITATVVVAFIGVVLMFRFADSREVARIDVQFNNTAETIAAAVRTELRTAESALGSLQSFFDSSEFVGPEEFRQFTSRTLSDNSSISALSWNPFIRHEQRLLFERARLPAEQAASGIYEIGPDGQRMPAQRRDAYVVVEYIEPLESHSAAVGYDTLSSPLRRDAILAALDRGKPVATRSIQLVQSDRPRPGMLVFAPVFESASQPTSPQARRRLVQGFVVSVVFIDALVANAVDMLDAKALTLDLFEQSDAGLMSPILHANGNVDGGDPAMVTERVLDFAGRELIMRISAGNEYLAAHRAPGVWFVLAAGLMLCAMLSGFLLILAGNAHQDKTRAMQLVRANARMEDEIVNRRSIQKELHREKEQAEVTLNCIAEGVISTDLSDRVVYMNPRAELLTGWTLADAAGRALTTVLCLQSIDESPDVEDSGYPGQIGAAETAANDALWLVSRDGQRYEIRSDTRRLRDSNGEVSGSVIVFQDETAARRLAREMAHRAAHDALTGLVNRDEFEKRLDRAIRRIRSQGGTHSLCFIDLDQFKVVNDTAGHTAGDRLLQQVAHLICNRVRSRDTLSRLGGDEFGLLLEHCRPEKAHEIATEIVNEINDFRFVWDEQIFGIGASVGLVVVDADTRSSAEAMQHADMACYTAKDLGRCRVHTFCSDDTHSRQRVSELRSAADLRSALDDDRLVLYMQEIRPIGKQSGGPRHYEMLVRLRSITGRLMAPGAFIRAAERYDMMSDLDRWVIRETVARFDEIGGAGTNVSINLSGNSLGKEAFADFVINELRAGGVPGSSVCFEITETAAIRNLEAALTFIQRLSGIGCRFALDDFGSGISSFSYLKTLPVHYLKIDGSLVRGVAEEASARAMVAAIHDVARSMRLETVAEHVSDDAILAAVEEIGIDYAQGYAIDRPAPVQSSTVASANDNGSQRPHRLSVS